MLSLSTFIYSISFALNFVYSMPKFVLTVNNSRIQRRVQNSVKYPKWSFWRKQVTTESRFFAKQFILDIWENFEDASGISRHYSQDLCKPFGRLISSQKINCVKSVQIRTRKNTVFGVFSQSDCLHVKNLPDHRFNLFSISNFKHYERAH